MIINSKKEAEIIQYSSWQLIQDVFKLLKPYRREFWLASFIKLIGDLAWLYPTFAFASIINFLVKYQPGQSLNTLWIILGLWFIVRIVRSLSQYYSKFIGLNLAVRAAIDSELMAIKHMFQLDMEWHERENSGNKIKRIQNASNGFNRIIDIWFNNIIEIIVNLIAMNIIIAQFDQTVLILTIIFLITYFIISRVMSRKASQASYNVNVSEEEYDGLLFEVINNIRTVKVMSIAQKLYINLVTELEELLSRIKVQLFWHHSRSTFLSFWSEIFKIGIIIFIIQGVLNGQYEIGFLILFHSYFSNLHNSIDALSIVSLDFNISKLSIARMKNILDEIIKIDNDNGKISLPTDWKKISIKNVTFTYGKNQALNNVSFDINRGEKIGIVGVSGAGKSTLFKLLLKEREEFSGDILFDNLSIKKIKKNDYFKQVSVVLQDTEVFNFSLRDNITITNNVDSTNKELLDQALMTAHITELVDKLPQGLDTLIGEKGVKLSGGERQRLGLARAIFRQPEILLLDEATSHLDLESEEKIRDSLHNFLGNVTAVIIAHRLTTIKEMDKILVIEDGKIIESGNFEELFAKRGRFYELWEKQKF